MRVSDTQYGGNLDLNYNKIINLTAKRRAAPLVDRDSNLELIGHTELSAAAASIEFASIPGRFRHLLVVGSWRGTRAAVNDGTRVRINGDTAANYDAAGYYVNDSATMSGTGSDGPGVTFIPVPIEVAAGNAPTGSFSPVQIFIPDYSNTARHKSLHGIGGSVFNTTAGNINAATSSGRWRSTSAITKITFDLESATNSASGCAFSLYGIRSKRFLVDPTNTLCNDLIAYWKLNETGGKRLDSWGANHLTDNNTTTYGEGIRGNAAQFSKDNSEYLSISDNADISTGDIDYTITAWVFLYSDSTHQKFISKADNNSPGGTEYSAQFALDIKKLQFEPKASGGGPAGTVSSDDFGTVSPGTWYFVVMWHDAANDQCGIQVNNTKPTTAATTAATVDTGASVRIGTHLSTPTHSYNGLIQNVGFWKKVLTPGERTALWNQGKGNTLVDA